MVANIPHIKGNEQPVEGGNDHQLQILLAYDGSQHAHAAIDLLVDIFIREDITAPSRRGIPPDRLPAVTLLSIMPTQYISGHETLQAALDQTKKTLEEKGLQVMTALKAGNPAATINEYAKELKVDFTLVGAKGLRATLGILLGGVAQQVVEYSCCPVLVVRAPYEKTQRILLVTDGSTYSQLALEYLAERRFPLPDNSEVHVMHVMPPRITAEMAARSWVVVPEAFYPPPTQPVDLEAVEAEEEQNAEALLERSVDTLRTAGLRAKSVLTRGDAATEIIEYVKTQGMDLIVCGSRGLSQVQGWLLGSVSRKLVHYAGCSVLIVKLGEIL